MAFPQAFRRFIATALTLPLLGGLSPAWAGEDYELKIDRFDGTKAAHYDSSLKECQLLKSLNDSRISYCFFIHSTESLVYPVVVMATTSQDWQLLDYRSQDKASAIITYLDGSVVRAKLPIDVDGTVISRGLTGVSESVSLYLVSIKDEFENISQIEVQVGTREYLWKPDPVLTKKALNFEEP